MQANTLTTFGLTIALVIATSDAARAEFILSKRAIAPEIFEGPKQPQGLEELEKALQSFKQREYDQALDHLKAARRKRTDLPPPRLMLARLFLTHSQISLGRAALEQAARDNPDYPGIYLGFGNIALAEGRPMDALVHYEKAGALVKAGRWTAEQERFFLIQFHAGTAQVAERRRDWPAAQSALGRWLELDAKDGKARQRLARVLFELEKRPEALEELERAVKDDPSLPPAATTFAWLFNQKGDLEKAGAWMDHAIKANPKDAKAHLGLARWLFQHGKGKEGKAHAETAAKLDPESREAKLLQGLIARQLREYVQAEQYFQSLHHESPADMSASNQLALVLVEQADAPKQKRALQLALVNARLAPESAETLSTLGWIYQRLGRLEEAERALRAAVKDGDASAETNYYLAHVLIDRGRPDEARPLLSSALRSSGFLYRTEAQECLSRLPAEEVP